MGDRVADHRELRSSGVARLGAEVSSSLEHVRVAQDAASRVRAKLVARQPSRLRTTGGPQLRLARVGVGLAFAASIALAAFFAWPRRPAHKNAGEALSFVVGQTAERGTTGAFIAAPTAAEMPVTFSDGSTVLLAPAARVRIAEVARDGARVLVESGAVHVSVVHKEETRWAVEAGPFEVRVTGTRFEVVWDPAATGLVVRLEEGSVYVRGCGLLGDEGRRLNAGEQLKVSCKDRASSVTPINTPEAVAAVTLPTPATPGSLPDGPPAAVVEPHGVTTAIANVAPPAPPADGSRGVISLARRGAHAEALMAAEANGFASTCDGLSGPELLVLADAARYANRFDRASEALEATRRRYATSDAAATAAFELGRIDMDIRRDLTGAGDHFEEYLRERPSGSLAREALGRAIEARHRAGNAAQAERLAVRYLAAYPDGPHAKLARKLSAPDPGSSP